MIDKQFCMSSYLAFRYIERDEMEFFEGLHHLRPHLLSPQERIRVNSAQDIDKELKATFAKLEGKKLGILLSGGMDSACLAAYMPQGSDAYTFRFGKEEQDELHRAEQFAAACRLKLHYVDIHWQMVIDTLPTVMQTKGAPVHSIEPQIYAACMQAKKDGIECMIIGDAADYSFYGMDGLLSKDWTFDEYVKRSLYINPQDVLVHPEDILYVYERYRKTDKIDYVSFYDKVVTEESYLSYTNAFKAADMPFVDPYEPLIMVEPVDLERTRRGDSKYFIRELFRMKYPQFSVPEKHPMPRPVDIYFKNWQGPTRPEFNRDLDMSQFTGNQKWLLWCLEQFLNMYEPLKIGYTTGVYDLFHIGHLNLLRKAKAQCDYLIVGVSTDDLVEYKGKRSVIPFEERQEIVGAIKYVDEVVAQENMDKLGAWKKYHFDVMFVGDDWKGTDKWNKIEADLAEVGAKVIYFPYTKGTSSTLINETLVRLREENK